LHLNMLKNCRVRSSFGRWGWRNVRETVARARFHVKIVTNCGVWSSFGRWGRKNVHETVARARFDKLDDGWPESVEEQSLLLLVWRHYNTREYIKDVL